MEMWRCWRVRGWLRGNRLKLWRADLRREPGAWNAEVAEEAEVRGERREAGGGRRGLSPEFWLLVVVRR